MFQKLLLFASLAFFATLQAQTIGTPNRNNLQVQLAPNMTVPAGAGATSCTSVGTWSSPTTQAIAYQVNVSPAATGAVLFLSLCGPCGGASTLNFGSTAPGVCGGGNAGACPGGPANANLCWALNLSPGCWLNVPMFPSTPAGWYTVRFNVPAGPWAFVLRAQAVIVDPCSTGGWHMSQALVIN